MAEMLSMRDTQAVIEEIDTSLGNDFESSEIGQDWELQDSFGTRGVSLLLQIPTLEHDDTNSLLWSSFIMLWEISMSIVRQLIGQLFYQKRTVAFCAQVSN